MQTALTPTTRRIRIPALGGRRRGVLFLHELRALLLIAGPIVVSQLGQVGMNTTDTLMVAPLGATALAAAGLGSALHMAVLMFFTGTVLGMGPLVSQAFGAGNREACRRTLVQGLWLALALSAPMMWISLEGRAVSLALGQDPAVSDLAGGYMAALAWGVVPAMLFMALRQYLEGMGRSGPAMVATLGGLAVNVVANQALIHGVGEWIPALGVVGSGWATTLVRWVMLLGLLAYVLAAPGLHPFRGVLWRPSPELLRRITGIGLPIGAQLGFEVSLFSFAAVMMGWFGALELGAHQVTINIAATTFMVGLGASLAGSIRVGHHVGAGRRRGAHRAALGTYTLAVGFMGLCALLFLTIPGALIGLYTRDPEIVRLGSSLLLMAALFQIFDGGQVAGLCALRGAADTRVPMLMTALGYWLVGIPAAYLLGFHTPLGPSGIWLGLCLALATVAVLLALRVRRVLWQKV
jgi:MATE family multidrug resistance protein